MPLQRMIGFVFTAKAEEAKAFYRDVLRFKLIEEDEFALVFDANGTMLRVAKVPKFTPAQGTVLGWQVDEIYAIIKELKARGVLFEKYNLSFMKQDKHGVWEPRPGDKVAWFKDADGNVLSISEHGKA